MTAYRMLYLSFACIMLAGIWLTGFDKVLWNAEPVAEAEARAQEAAGQMQQAEQNAADAQQQVRGAQEDAAIFRESE